MTFKTLFKLSVLPGGKVNTAEKPAQADKNKDRSTVEEDDSNEEWNSKIKRFC
jgi:hypothetical protein